MDKFEKSIPLMVGTNKWSMMRQSLQTVLEETNSTYLVLSFFRDNQTLPLIGFTDLPAKELFWELVEHDDLSTKDSKFVAAHKWSTKDIGYWNNLECGNGTSVVIYFQKNHQEPNKINVYFEHDQNRSLVYKYSICPFKRDAYLMFFTPISKFRNGNDLRAGQLALLSSYQYLSEQKKRRESGVFNDKIQTEYSKCVTCISAFADIVFIPCGHASFCSRCIKSYKSNKCPLCNAEFLETELSRCQCKIVPGRSCAICPTQYGCAKMNCMLIPCGCIVGCFDYSKRAIIPSEGDKCPHCNAEVQKLQKIYIQAEGTEI